METELITQVNKTFRCNVLSNNRKQNNAYGRFATGNYLRNNLSLKLEYIGLVLGKTHATIIYYTKIHQILYSQNKNYKKKYDELIIELENKV